MIEIFGYKFAERWAEISPRYAEYDQVPDLQIVPFGKYAERQSLGIGPSGAPRDVNPLEVQNLMVSGPVLMAYCNDLIGRINGLLTDRRARFSKMRAGKLANIEAKSEAERERKLSTEPDLESIKWEIEDLENMGAYLTRKIKELVEMTQNWRSVFYGTQVEKKIQPPIEAPVITGGR